MQIKDEYALITGATSGIGLELAKLFAQDGYNLIIVARNSEELQRTEQALRSKFGVRIISIVKDLFQPEAPFELYKEVKNLALPIEFLVNNAGQGYHGLFVDNDIHRELDIIELNVCSLVVLTKFILKDMVRAGHGRILNLASVASEAPGPWHAVYHATKAFVLSFTEAIQYETKDTGVTITALQPGVTDTDFFNKADMNDAKAVQDKDKMADPADVAKDGYEAMMAGELKVVSGYKNKLQVALGNFVTDKVSTKMMAKENEPVETSSQDR